MDSKKQEAQFALAKKLIKVKDYKSARKVLKQINHPTAKQWLSKLDEVAPEEQQSDAWLWGVVAIIGVLLVAMVGVLISPLSSLNINLLNNINTNNTLVALPEPTITNTPNAIESQVTLYSQPRNYFSQGANFRSCPDLSDDCNLNISLITGQPVIVFGEIEGETWLQSRTWYYLESNGIRGFVHSQFVTADRERPTSTPAPQILQPPPSSNSNRRPTTNTGSQAVCDCSGNRYDCSSFSTRNEAVACFNYCRQIGRGDIHNMDGDSDGVACENR